MSSPSFNVLMYFTFYYKATFGIYVNMRKAVLKFNK